MNEYMIKTETERVRDVVAGFIPGCPQEAADREAILSYFSVYDDLLTRENKLLHFTASAWVMNPGRSRVLMAHHNIYNAWSWLGGHADGCGDLFGVARRELAEETGVNAARAVSQGPLSLEMIGVQAHEKCGVYVAPHLHLNVTYFFEVEETVSLRIKADENSGVKWRSIAEVRTDNTEPHMRTLYCKLLDKLGI